MTYRKIYVTSNFVCCFLLTMVLSGCYTFNPQPGMSVKQVSDEAYVPCHGSSNINDYHISFVKYHPEIPSVSIYQTDSHVKYKRASTECQMELYFSNGKLLSDEELQDMLVEYKNKNRFEKKRIGVSDANAASNAVELQNNRRKTNISSLEKQLKSISDDYEWDLNNFKQYRCYGWGGKYPSLEACVVNNDFDSVAWEKYLQKRISYHSVSRANKQAAARDRDLCLSNAPIGICQSSKQNELMYLCGTNFITGMENITNQYCYVTDDFNITAKMEVRNNTGQSVKDIYFECEQIAKSGTVLQKNSETVYDVWKPNEIKVVNIKFRKHGQVSNLRCVANKWRN